jgi:hypothetical protein
VPGIASKVLPEASQASGNEEEAGRYRSFVDQKLNNRLSYEPRKMPVGLELMAQANIVVVELFGQQPVGLLLWQVAQVERGIWRRQVLFITLSPEEEHR